MINLSKLYYSDVSLLEKVKHVMDPDIYLAESVADFKENARKVILPFYKRRFSIEPSCFITIKGVGIDLLESNEYLEKYFSIHDYSSLMVAVWNSFDDSFYSPMRSYEQVQCEDGLRKQDFVYSIDFLYLINKNLPLIINVEKNKSGKKEQKKESLIDRVKDFFDGQFEPVFSGI